MHMASTTTSVLTVEDDPIVRVDLRLVLESAGFEVCPDARDGVEAVELAREHEPDVILLDLGLPRLSGVDATRMILAERDVPIVALTGRSARHADEAVAAGVTSVVNKPFDGGAVVRALSDAIVARERRISRDALAELLYQLGYPEDWSDDLERRAFAQGRVWRSTHASPRGMSG
jgi:two-component system, response regulator PdtaR